MLNSASRGSISSRSLGSRAHFAPVSVSPASASPARGGVPEKQEGIAVYTVWEHTLGSLGIELAGSVHSTMMRMPSPLKARLAISKVFPFFFYSITLPCSFPQIITVSSAASHWVTQIT